MKTETTLQVKKFLLTFIASILYILNFVCLVYTVYFSLIASEAYKLSNLFLETTSTLQWSSVKFLDQWSPWLDLNFLGKLFRSRFCVQLTHDDQEYRTCTDTALSGYQLTPWAQRNSCLARAGFKPQTSRSEVKCATT